MLSMIEDFQWHGSFWCNEEVKLRADVGQQSLPVQTGETML